MGGVEGYSEEENRKGIGRNTQGMNTYPSGRECEGDKWDTERGGQRGTERVGHIKGENRKEIKRGTQSKIRRGKGRGGTERKIIGRGLKKGHNNGGTEG